MYLFGVRYPKAYIYFSKDIKFEYSDALIYAIYYAPSYPAHSESLSRKPDSLMLERAISRYSIDPAQSGMVGDSKRDLEAAEKVGVRSILVGYKYQCPNRAFMQQSPLKLLCYLQPFS
ncbi:HAD hydrolase-like protein [Pontibacter sp. HJ8]